MFPKVIQIEILLHCNLATLARILSTCKHWHKLSKEDLLWKRRLEKDFPLEKFPNIEWSNFQKYRRLAGAGIYRYFPEFGHEEKDDKGSRNKKILALQLFINYDTRSGDPFFEGYYLSAIGEVCDPYMGRKVYSDVQKVYYFHDEYLYYQDFENQDKLANVKKNTEKIFNSKFEIQKIHPFSDDSLYLLTTSGDLYFIKKEEKQMYSDVSTFNCFDDCPEILVTFKSGKILLLKDNEPRVIVETGGKRGQFAFWHQHIDYLSVENDLYLDDGRDGKEFEKVDNDVVKFYRWDKNWFILDVKNNFTYYGGTRCSVLKNIKDFLVTTVYNEDYESVCVLQNQDI